MSLKKVCGTPFVKKCVFHLKLSRKQFRRGMIAYAVIWPTGCIIHQKIEGREELDYWRIARFCIFGSLYVAPTLTIWMTIARAAWPQQTFRAAITKGLVEQVTYTPFAMTSFYFGMTLLEMKTIEEAKQEVEDKFLPTYKVGAPIWPIIQTINYLYVPEKNRIVYVSFCSLLWTTFLAYMKQMKSEDAQQFMSKDKLKPKT